MLEYSKNVENFLWDEKFFAVKIFFEFFNFDCPRILHFPLLIASLTSATVSFFHGRRIFFPNSFSDTQV